MYFISNKSESMQFLQKDKNKIRHHFCTVLARKFKPISVITMLFSVNAQLHLWDKRKSAEFEASFHLTYYNSWMDEKYRRNITFSFDFCRILKRLSTFEEIIKVKLLRLTGLKNPKKMITTSVLTTATFYNIGIETRFVHFQK